MTNWEEQSALTDIEQRLGRAAEGLERFTAAQAITAALNEEPRLQADQVVSTELNDPELFSFILGRIVTAYTADGKVAKWTREAHPGAPYYTFYTDERAVPEAGVREVKAAEPSLLEVFPVAAEAQAPATKQAFAAESRTDISPTDLARLRIVSQLMGDTNQLSLNLLAGRYAREAGLEKSDARQILIDFIDKGILPVVDKGGIKEIVRDPSQLPAPEEHAGSYKTRQRRLYRKRALERDRAEAHSQGLPVPPNKETQRRRALRKRA
jgi:hypothetical protein